MSDRLYFIFDAVKTNNKSKLTRNAISSQIGAVFVSYLSFIDIFIKVIIAEVLIKRYLAEKAK